MSYELSPTPDEIPVPMFRSNVRGNELMLDWSDPERDRQTALVKIQDGMPKSSRYTAFMQGFLGNRPTLLECVGGAELALEYTNALGDMPDWMVLPAMGLIVCSGIGRVFDGAVNVREHRLQTRWVERHAANEAVAGLQRQRAKNMDQALTITDTAYTYSFDPTDLSEKIETHDGKSVAVNSIIRDMTQVSAPSFDNGHAAKVNNQNSKRTRRRFLSGDTDFTKPVIVEFKPALLVDALVHSDVTVSDQVLTDSIENLVEISSLETQHREQTSTLKTANKLSGEISAETVLEMEQALQKTTRTIIDHTLDIGANWLAYQRAELAQKLEASISQIEIGSTYNGASSDLRAEALRTILNELQSADAIKAGTLADLRKRTNKVFQVTQ